MNKTEQHALGNYLESRLVAMIETVEPHVEYAVRKELYCQCAAIVADVTDPIVCNNTPPSAVDQ